MSDAAEMFRSAEWAAEDEYHAQFGPDPEQEGRWRDLYQQEVVVLRCDDEINGVRCYLPADHRGAHQLPPAPPVPERED